ncbi:MAG: hypothetical protein AAGC82_14355 [Pseudomonadota bacterium]
MTARPLLAVLADPDRGFAGAWPDHIQVGRFAAVFADLGFLPRMRRKAAFRAASARQAALENLMQHGTVLPALAQAKIPPAMTESVLNANAAMLDTLSARLKGRLQYQLRIGGDEHVAKDWLAGRGIFVDVADAAAEMRRLLAPHVEAIAELCDDTRELPLGPSLWANIALLLAEDHAIQLDREIEALDAVWTDGLAIRLIGPSPAVSFASLGTKRHAPATVDTARTVLGIDGSADAGQIAAAERAALFAGQDPDQIRRAAELVLLAAQHPKGAPLWQFYIWGENRAMSEAPSARRVA